MKPLLTPSPHRSKQAQRNEGAISLIVEKLRSELLKAVDTPGFFGAVLLEARIFNEDISEFDVSARQQIKVK